VRRAVHASGGETGLRFPGLAAGIYKQDVALKWQSRTSFSPARVLFGHSLRETCVSGSWSGEGNNAARVGDAPGGRQWRESRERGDAERVVPAWVPAAAAAGRAAALKPDRRNR